MDRTYRVTWMPPTPHKLTYWNTYIVPIHTDTACKLTWHVGTCPAINVLCHFLQNMYRCVYRHNSAWFIPYSQLLNLYQQPHCYWRYSSIFLWFWGTVISQQHPHEFREVRKLNCWNRVLHIPACFFFLNKEIEIHLSNQKKDELQNFRIWGLNLQVKLTPSLLDCWKSGWFMGTRPRDPWVMVKGLKKDMAERQRKRQRGRDGWMTEWSSRERERG